MCLVLKENQPIFSHDEQGHLELLPPADKACEVWGQNGSLVTLEVVVDLDETLQQGRRLF